MLANPGLENRFGLPWREPGREVAINGSRRKHPRGRADSNNPPTPGRVLDCGALCGRAVRRLTLYEAVGTLISTPKGRHCTEGPFMTWISSTPDRATRSVLIRGIRSIQARDPIRCFLLHPHRIFPRVRFNHRDDSLARVDTAC